MCGDLAAELAGACEIVGLGPEDPLADGCAARGWGQPHGSGVRVACEAALEGGFDLTSDYVVEHLGC